MALAMLGKRNLYANQGPIHRSGTQLVAGRGKALLPPHFYRISRFWRSQNRQRLDWKIDSLR
jgi:hypothetical protein